MYQWFAISTDKYKRHSRAICWASVGLLVRFPNPLATGRLDYCGIGCVDWSVRTWIYSLPQSAGWVEMCPMYIFPTYFFPFSCNVGVMDRGAEAFLFWMYVPIGIHIGHKFLSPPIIGESCGSSIMKSPRLIFSAQLGRRWSSSYPISWLFNTISIPHICHKHHQRCLCKNNLPSVNFSRCNAKNWHFTV